MKNRHERVVGGPRVVPWRELGLVAATVVFLEVLVFRGYFAGETIPQFDFMGAYNLEAYAWWKDGSFFSPVQWMPYMWGGYPGVSNLQNSSFYLPVGLTAAITPFTLHASAILSAIHVGFGAAGIYVFARRWGVRVAPALCGLAGWFFIGGFYSNATNLDIMRAYAWIPWIMLTCSVKWPWQKWWAALIGLLVLWQSILGIYPGMLIALAYALPFWILANQVFFRPRLRIYLVPLIFVGSAAVLMTLVRYLPALLTRGVYPALSPDTSEMPLSVVGTFLFPYNNPALPSFEGMRSFFIPAVFLALIAFVPVRNRLFWAVLPSILVAVALGFPFWPWHDFVSAHLPGMQLSRFRMSDFKFVLLFGLMICGVLAINSLAYPSESPDPSIGRKVPPLFRWVPVGLAALVPAVFAMIGARYSFEPLGSIPQWLILAGACSIFSFTHLRRTGLGIPSLFALGTMTVVSGVLSIYAVPGEWTTDRITAEKSYYGSTVADLIALRSDVTSVNQRPARVPIPEYPSGEESVSSKYGTVFYTGGSSVFGYVNLRGTETFELVKQEIYQAGDQGLNIRAFWEYPGVVVPTTSITAPLRRITTECLAGNTCNEALRFVPLIYDSKGRFEYSINADVAMNVSLNEAAYLGWHAQICRGAAGRECSAVDVTRGKVGQISLNVPAGTSRLVLHYELPGMAVAWFLFWIGAALASAVTLSGALSSVFAERRSNNGGNGVTLNSKRQR